MRSGSPGEPGPGREDDENDGFRKDDGHQRLEEVRLEVVDRDREADVGGRDHLACDTEDHGDAGQIKRAGHEARHDRHHDGNVALAHAGEDADDEARECDDDGHGKRRAFEAGDDLVQDARGLKKLDEEEDAADVEEKTPCLLYTSDAADD